MSALDYYQDPQLVAYMGRELSYITNREDREDCQQEIFAELYNWMPLDILEAKRLVKRVCEKFKRGQAKIAKHETTLNEAIL